MTYLLNLIITVDVGTLLMKVEVKDFDKDVLEYMAIILNKGNSIEVKKVKDEIVVVEIQRRVKTKSPITR